jgi:hypothetical protein
MSVRYVAVPQRLVPGGTGSQTYPVPPDVLTGLAAQLDLRELPSDPALVVYENTAWGPLRAATSEPVAAQAGPRSTGADLSGARPVLGGRRAQVRYHGPVPAQSDVLVSEASGHWSLTVAGHTAPHERAFGWANRYRSASGGRATLSYVTPLLRYLAVLVELVVWVAVLRALIRSRRRRRELQS